jgi:hypothetical protein
MPITGAWVVFSAAAAGGGVFGGFFGPVEPHEAVLNDFTAIASVLYLA